MFNDPLIILLAVVCVILFFIGLKSWWGPVDGALKIIAIFVFAVILWDIMAMGYNHGVVPIHEEYLEPAHDWAHQPEPTRTPQAAEPTMTPTSTPTPTATTPPAEPTVAAMQPTAQAEEGEWLLDTIHVPGGSDPKTKDLPVSQGYVMIAVGRFFVDETLYEWIILPFDEVKTYHVTVTDGTVEVVSDEVAEQVWCELISTNHPETIGDSPYICS